MGSWVWFLLKFLGAEVMRNRGYNIFSKLKVSFDSTSTTLRFFFFLVFSQVSSLRFSFEFPRFYRLFIHEYKSEFQKSICCYHAYGVSRMPMVREVELI